MATFRFPAATDTLSGMDLQEDDLKEFIELWSEEFHETISMQDAKLRASALLHLYRLLVSEPLKKSNPPSDDEVLPLLPKIE